MKKLNKYLFILAAAVFTFTACEKEIERPDSPNFDGKKAVFFPVSTESEELEPTATFEHAIKIARDTNNHDALTAKLIVTANTQDIFVVPEVVEFAANVTETTFLVTFPKAQVDSTYTLGITLEADNSNPYRTLNPSYTYTVNIAKWNPVTDKKAVVFDGLTNVFYGVGNPAWYAPYARKDNADGSFDIRLLNPYTILPEYDMTAAEPYDNPIADEFGIYGGYPYNYPEDVDSEGTYNMTIHVDKKGQATFDDFALGMIWSYGMFYGAHATSKGMGVYNKADQSITFEGGTVACAMANYKDGAFNLGSEPMIIYLDDALWKDINSVVTVDAFEDGFNDAELTWNDVEGGLHTFLSEVQSDAWDVQLQNSVDPNPEDKQGPSSEFYNLYRLTDVYAEDFCLAFYWDTIKGKVSLPVDLQPTGLEFASKAIFVGPSAEKESYVETIDLKGDQVNAFHFFLQIQTLDGGNLGTYEEVFYFGPNAIVWEKKDYLGKFILAGTSPFNGSAMKQTVEIKEDGEDLIMLGVARADTIVLAFDEATGVLSIEPQMLPGVFSYQGTDYPLVLATFDADFNIGFTASLDFAFDLTGVAKLTATSTAIGYLVIANGLAGGNLAGCMDLSLSPAPATAAVVARQAGEATLLTGALKAAPKTAKQPNFKLQGKVQKHNFFMKH